MSPEKETGTDSLVSAFSPATGMIDRPPAWMARVVSAVLCVFVLLVVAYASVAHMDVVLTGTGRIVPSGKTTLVQANTAGIVHSVAVQDGQRVQAGDLLMEIDVSGRRVSAVPAVRQADATKPFAVSTALLDTRLLESLTKLAAAQAEVARRQSERNTLTGALAELHKSFGMVTQKTAMREKLAASGHVPQSTLIDARLELLNLQKEIHAHQNRAQEVEAALTAAIQNYTQAEADYKARYPVELVEVAKRHVAEEGAEANTGAQRVYAPVDGVVRWLTSLAPGEPIGNHQNLLVIVPPQAPLEAEVMVANKDIGHLRVGQRAVVKIETYDYTRYGYIDGTVQWVGVDAIDDPKLGPVYAARVSLSAFEMPNTVNGVRGRLAPGMSVTADVRVSERRMISYFLSPLLRYKEESLRER